MKFLMISIWQKGGVLQEKVLQQEKERLKKKFPERSIEWRNKMIVWWECDAMVTLTTPSGSLPLSHSMYLIATTGLGGHFRTNTKVLFYLQSSWRKSKKAFRFTMDLRLSFKIISAKKLSVADDERWLYCKNCLVVILIKTLMPVKIITAKNY